MLFVCLEEVPVEKFGEANGINQDPEAVRPSGEGEPERSPFPETPDELASNGILAAITASRTGDEEPVEDPSDDAQDDLDDEPVEPEEDDDEPDEEVPTAEQGEADEPERPKTAEQWAEVLVRDPQRISEVPGRHRAEAMRLYGDRLRAQAVEEATRTVTERLNQQKQITEWVAKVDESFADDPDGMLAWLRQGGEDALFYTRATAYLKSLEGKPVEEIAQSSVALNERAKQQFARLDRLPAEVAAEFKQRIQENAQKQRYPMDDAGLTLLSQDIDEYLSEGFQKAAKVSPAAKKSATRAASAAARRTLPRPDASSGRQTPTDDISNINDPSQLIAMGLRQSVGR